jgi:VIT1/CCC1 family predicted Fe2+/Mn2+ transporter
MKNWKTSVNGILAAIIGAAGPLTAYLATMNNSKAAVASGIVTLVAAIARVWVGILQNDAPAVNG